MSQKYLENLNDRLRQMQSADRHVDLTSVLKRELEAASNDEDKSYVYGLLATELQSQGRVQEAEDAIRSRLEIQPNKPDAWISLALHLFHYSQLPQEALSAIDTAIEKANLDGNFVRQSHIERVRIALGAAKYSLVEESLKELLDYEPRYGSLDVALEGEFLSQIPEGKVSREILEKYTKKL